MVDEPTGATPGGTDIYDRIGVRKIINARAATTAVGGTLMPPEVSQAMIEAANGYVVISELNAAVGELIARCTGAEAGYVTAGSAAGMLLAVAACMTGTDPARIKQLPDATGMPDEVVIHRAHRINYDQMFRAPGARLVEIGIPSGTQAWELEQAIGERTAAVAYVDSPSVGPGALDFATVVEVSRRRGVPVIVDAASTLPPVSHLTRWIEWGADLVIYSGGKGIRGPQDSGLLAGRRDLIAAAAANGAPNAAIGRGMKVSKEAMAGLYVALERFMSHDHEREFREQQAWADVIWEAIASHPDVDCDIIADQAQYPAPVVMVRPRNGRWNPVAVQGLLMQGTPPVHVNANASGLEVHTHCLLDGQARAIASALRSALSAGSI
jgi:D-glucosaminate-6-phosphate ammonia-lyase